MQGEGPFAGTPAVFVRLAGCNLQCPFCDTDYTSGRQQITVEQCVTSVLGIRSYGLVVITGGEPFRQNITPLCQALLDVGYTVQIETNGTMFADVDFPPEVVIVCSPKTGGLHHVLQTRVNAWKYVLEAGRVDSDGLPTSILGAGRPARPPKGHPGRVYVQPLDYGNGLDSAENSANLKAAVQSCMDHGYSLCLQLHKQLGLP